jgi:cation diffusion facilitator family transporter
VLSTKRSVAALSIASNATLVTLKLVAGLATGSVSVFSEAIHSSIDLLAAIMAFFAVRASAKPPDDEHRFGHGKAESLSGAAEALLIFVAALMIINEAVQKLLHGVELESVDLGIAIMAISAVANIFVSRQLMRVAKSTRSMALEADAWHLTTDVLTSAGVAVGLLVVRLTGLSVLDPIIAIGVALFICKAAYDITRRSLRDLLDGSLPIDEQAVIRAVLDRHSGDMVGYHEIRSRRSGADRHVDLHLVMNRNVTVKQSHDLCDHLENDLKGELGDVTLNIHVEPCEPDCTQCDSGCEEDAEAPRDEKAS